MDHFSSVVDNKHGISAASEAFGVSCRTLYWWRQLLNKGGPDGLIPHSKAPLVRRKKHWHPDVLKEIRRLRTELPNLGKEQIFVRLKPWCEQRYLCHTESAVCHTSPSGTRMDNGLRAF